jgi:hypothetical protein
VQVGQHLEQRYDHLQVHKHEGVWDYELHVTAASEGGGCGLQERGEVCLCSQVMMLGC